MAARKETKCLWRWWWAQNNRKMPYIIEWLYDLGLLTCKYNLINFWHIGSQYWKDMRQAMQNIEAFTSKLRNQHHVHCFALHTTCQTNLIFLHLITLIFSKHDKLWSSSLRSFLQPNITPSLLGSTVLNLCSFLYVTDQVSHVYTKHQVKLQICI